MGKIVVKFGGSSLADAAQFRKVRDIIRMDPRRCYVVPSAPGRRFPEDEKITDLLYQTYRAQRNGENIEPIFRRVRERYLSIAEELGLSFPIARELGFTLRGDYGLGVFNGQTLKELKRLGFRSATLSFELKLAQIRDLSKGLDSELVVYGRLPLMITENCIIHNHSGRHTCANVNLLTDRKGERFPVVKAPGCRNEILNSKKLFLADKAGDWQRLGLWAGRLMFTTENARECVQVLERYLGRGSYQPNDYTRGLYYRGVE